MMTDAEERPYYNGLRFMINVASSFGEIHSSMVANELAKLGRIRCRRFADFR
jgi:hypothetical protein